MTHSLVDEVNNVLTPHSDNFRAIFYATTASEITQNRLAEIIYALTAFSHQDTLSTMDLTRLLTGSGDLSRLGVAAGVAANYIPIVVEGPEDLILGFMRGLLLLTPASPLPSSAAGLLCGERQLRAQYRLHDRPFTRCTIVSYQSLVSVQVVKPGVHLSTFPHPAEAEDRRLSLLRDPEVAALLTYNALTLFTLTTPVSALDLPPLELLQLLLPSRPPPLAPAARGSLASLSAGEVAEETVPAPDAHPVRDGTSGQPESLYTVQEFLTEIVYSDKFELIPEVVPPVQDSVALAAAVATARANIKC